MKEYVVRRLSDPSEVRAAWRLRLELYDAAIAPSLAPDPEGRFLQACRTLDCNLTDMLRSAEEPDRVLMAAFVDDQLVGSASAAREGELLFLSGCYVARPGLGIGSALLHWRLGWGDGCRRARLAVAQKNQAGIDHALRHGFQPAGQRPSRVAEHITVLLFERDL